MKISDWIRELERVRDLHGNIPAYILYDGIEKDPKMGVSEIETTFDDSVIVDKELQRSQDQQAVSMGVMGKVEFRMRNYKEDEATAKKKVAEATAEQPADMFANQGA